MDFGYISASVIMMTMLGLAVGNYATSLTYRLPRGLKVANDPPYCDTCRTYLQTRDMFPFLSWVINRAKCRFCGAPVPALYAFVELGCALLFNAAWFVFWPDAVDLFLVVLALGIFLITLISLHVAEKRLFPVVLLLVAGLGAINRVLFDGDIFGFIMGGYLGLMGGVAGWLLQSALARRRLPFPAYAIMLGIAGLCVGKAGLGPLFLLSAGVAVTLWIVGRKSAAIRGSEGVMAVSAVLFWLLLFPGFLTTNSSECAKVLCEDGKGCRLVIVSDCHRP